MPERKPDEIRLFSKLPFLVFADAYYAQIVGMKPSQDNDGKDVWDFVLNPSDELIKRYNLKPNLNNDMLFAIQIPYDLVICLNPDPAWCRYLYLGTLNGVITPAMKILNGTTQQLIIMKLKDENTELKQKLEVANEKTQLLEQNIPKYLQQNFGVMLEQFQPIVDKLGLRSTKND